jgi:hypothetical protein
MEHYTALLKVLVNKAMQQYGEMHMAMLRGKSRIQRYICIMLIIKQTAHHDKAWKGIKTIIP